LNPKQPPAVKSSGRGCLVVVIAIGSLVVLGAIAAVVSVFNFARSDRGQELMSVAGEAQDLLEGAGKAEGMADLMDAGCEAAVELDLDRLRQLGSTFVDGGLEQFGSLHSTISCTVAAAERTPSCDDLAKRYVQAVGGEAKGTFQLIITRSGRETPACSVKYSELGEKLGD
jgi:hypothetical protein